MSHIAEVLREAAQKGALMEAAIKQNLGGVGHEWDRIVTALYTSMGAQCKGSSCLCQDLQAGLQQLLTKAAQQRPRLEDLLELGVHMVLPEFSNQLPTCPHVLAARLAVAEAYYKLIALPEYRRRAQAAAETAAAGAARSERATVSPVEERLYDCKGLVWPASFYQGLMTLWNKVLRKLQKAAEAVPLDNQPMKPANASTLSVWICEGPKGIDSKMDGLLQPSHTMILWAAAACRVASENVFMRQLAVTLVQPAAGLAAALLDVTTTMGRLSAAGISFNTQPSPAAVAAAIDLAVQVFGALSPYQHTLIRLGNQKHGEQPQALPLPPLYLSPLQQQQQGQEQHDSQAILGPLEVAGRLPAKIYTTMQNYAQLWSLGAPVLCFYGTQLLRQWEQQLQQLQQQQGCTATPAAAAVAAAGDLSGGCSSSSSSRSRPLWQHAEGWLLLGAAALEGTAAAPCPSQQQQQLQQQQLALCRQYQRQFQRAASSLGFSDGLFAEVAACFNETQQYSSSSSNSSEGAAAGSAAAADCLAVVGNAAFMMWMARRLVDPLTRRASSAEPNMRQLTAAEELIVADFFMQVPGLLSAAAGAAVQMQWLQGGGGAAAAAAANSSRGAVLHQLPMVAYLLHMYHNTWPPLSRLLCGELTAEEQAAMLLQCAVWKQHQELQQQLRQLHGDVNKSPAAACAAGRLVSVGCSSILLRQLLRMAAPAAAAAADSSQHLRQQRQQLTTVVLYYADALGGEVSLLVADLLAAVPNQGGLVLFDQKSSGIMAQALQLFEAAVRHLLAAGGTLRASSSSSSGSSSGGGSSSNSQQAVPPSVACVELSLRGIYAALMLHSYSSSASSRGLSRSLLQLLQAMLSMLLTCSKLWQGGLHPTLPLEGAHHLAAAAYACMCVVVRSPRVTCVTPAAAVEVALAASGGVQVCQLVSRYLRCFEQQLRQWVASEDAVGAAKWLSENVPPRIIPLPGESSSMAAAVAARADSRFDALCGLIEDGHNIACMALGGASHPGLQAGKSELSTRTSRAGTLLIAAGSQRGGLQRQQQLAFLGELGGLADALQGFGCALAASLPSRFGCNWPGCVRLSGVSEGYGLVRGQACVCGGCRQARYCSVACQAAHWPAHKAFCQQHQQPGGAAAVSVAATAAVAPAAP